MNEIYITILKNKKYFLNDFKSNIKINNFNLYEELKKK